MNVLVSYSRPRGKYGRYIFTVMIYFSYSTEKATIEVKRPQTETHTSTVYSCDHCGRWASIVIQQTTTVHTSLQPAAHQKDGRLELYRYDNVEPDDFMEFTLRDTDLLKYQFSRVDVGWHDVKVQNYWRTPKFDKIRNKDQLQSASDSKELYYQITGRTGSRLFLTIQK